MMLRTVHKGKLNVATSHYSFIVLQEDVFGKRKRGPRSRRSQILLHIRYDRSPLSLLPAPTQPHHSSKMNPVIADVVSLANGSATQPSVSADTALTG